MRTRGLIAVVVASVALGIPFSSASAAAAPSASTCDHLVVAMTSVGGGDGAGYVTVLFVNVGARCTMRGFPSVMFFSPQVGHLTGRDVRRSSMIFREPAAHRVTLARGGVASVGVSWQNDPIPHQSCPRTQWANVVMPDARRSNFQPSISARPCGSAIWMTPFETGAQPSLTWNAP